jgi:tetratricopeptide (TPR) repeat protein
MTDTHPDPGQLAAYVAGELDDADATVIADHLDACPDCCARAATLGADEFARELRAVGGSNGPPAAAGQRVGPFVLVREIGHGGMGVVYLAEQPDLGRQVALKLLPSAAKLMPGRLDRFRDEVRAAARLHHTNIVPVFEVGEADGAWYYAMPYIAGRSLDRLDEKPLAPDRVARIGAQVASALAHAHARGVLHRDVKPANLLLDDADRVWVTDFGVAKFLEEQGPATGTIVGTPRYMAPEQVAGKAEPRTDVYGLGITLYELATGRPAFADPSPAAVLDAVRAMDPPAPRAVRPDLPADLDTIIQKSIAKEPRDRYATAADLTADLERFGRGEPIAARRAGPVERLRKWARRRPAVAGLVAVSGLAAVALLAGGAYHTHALRSALTAETAANAAAAARAAEARDRLELALKANRQLVEEVKRIGNTASGRPLKRRLLAVAVAGLEEVAKSHPSTEPDEYRASAHLQLGNLYTDLGDRAKGLARYDEGAALARAAVAARPDRQSARLVLGGLLAARATVLIEAGDAAAADRAAAEMLAVAGGGGSDDPNLTHLAVVARCRLGRVLVERKEFDRARPVLEAARGDADRLAAAFPSNYLARMTQGDAVEHVRMLASATGDAAGERTAKLELVPVLRAAAAARPDDPAPRGALAKALGNLGLTHLQAREFAAARGCFVECEQVAGRLAADDPQNVPAQCEWAYAALRLAELERLTGNPAVARGWYSKCRDLLRPLKDAGKLADHPRHRDVLLPAAEQRLATLAGAG